MKPNDRRGAVLVAALLCATVTACGTARPGDAPARPAAASRDNCADRTTERPGPTGTTPATEDDPGTPGPPTDADAGTPGPPTDADPGTPGPPTDADPGTPGPPTDADAGTPGPPTDADPGTPGPPTDADAGTPGPPTDGSAAPCLPAGWFDMTRDFTDYYAHHLTKADDGMWPSVVAVRVRKHREAEEAVVTVAFDPPPGTSDWEGRRVAEVFADWRREVYDDRGTVRVETRGARLITASSW